MERKDHPNLLGAAVLALVFGLLLLGLSLYAKLTGGSADTDGVVMGAALLVIAGLAYEKHKQLAAMSPAERDRFWARKDAEWRETADAHARARLGDDYRPVRKEEP